MSTQRWILFSVLLITASALVAILLTPQLRENLLEHIYPIGREVLATAEGDLLSEGEPAKVIKYRTREGIFVEILRPQANGDLSLVDRIALPDKHDGLFNLHGRVTRLAVADVDGDGRMELLAPTFDNQLVPHLNVFRYSSATGRFEPVQPLNK